MSTLAQLVSAVQRNCGISDARHAGDCGRCTFLLKMREYYRWEHALLLALNPAAREAALESLLPTSAR